LGRAIYDNSDKLIVAADAKKSEIATTDANQASGQLIWRHSLLTIVRGLRVHKKATIHN